MKKTFATALVLGAALTAGAANAASLSSLSCSSDTLTFGFTGVSGETMITIEGSSDGSNWSLVGGGALSGSGSVSIEIYTADTEFTDIIASPNAASYRATIGSAVSSTFTCS